MYTLPSEEAILTPRILCAGPFQRQRQNPKLHTRLLQPFLRYFFFSSFARQLVMLISKADRSPGERQLSAALQAGEPRWRRPLRGHHARQGAGRSALASPGQV